MFNQFNLHERIQKSLNGLSLSVPTAVQKDAIPHALEGKDLFITAPTGTGKTLAYALPLIHTLLTQGKPGSGTQALVMLPTRELATQVYKVIKQLASYTFFEPLLVTGGEGQKEQAAKLRKNPDIVIGTPGRLLEQLKNNQLILKTLKILVLDETDRILDMGFGDDVTYVLNNCPTTKQTLLLSATKGDAKLQVLIKALLHTPVEIHLGNNQSHNNITQQAIFADNTAHKERLVEWLLAHESYDKAIIFTNTRHQAELLSRTFTLTQIKHGVLHSEKTADERKQVISRLNQKHIRILIATDVAARGLDISSLDLVINFDIPNTVDEYIHRIGRTGRMDNKGIAISLITDKEGYTYNKFKSQLKEAIEQRVIAALPSQLKGKNASLTKSFQNTEELVKKAKITEKSNTKNNKKIKPSTLISEDGFAPLKRKK